MTTVAWDGEYLVVDSQSQNGYDTIISTSVKKIFKTKAGGLVAGAGPIGIAQAYVKWFDGETEAPEFSDMYAVVYVDPQGKAWTYDNGPRNVLPAHKKGAFGTGSVYALGVLDHGGSALEAVKIAIKRDVYSGGKPQMFKYPDNKKVTAITKESST